MRFDFAKLKISVGLLAMSTLCAVPAAMAASPQTFTGTVSDAMCGAKHMMEGKGADCLRACVKQGSKYALVVGDKVYTLDSKDKATLDQLDKFADQKAKVKGTVDGDTIQVSSVAGAK